MRKHIKIQAIRVFTDFYAVQIVEQTHRDRDFGSDGKCGFEHNGFMIASEVYPEAHATHLTTYINRVNLRGRNLSRDKDVFIIHAVPYAKLCDTIRAYNDYFRGEDGGSTCPVIVTE